MNTKRGLVSLILLVIVAVVVISGGVYYFSQKTQTPDVKTDTQNTTVGTTDLKTYTNAEYGFEFKYPTTVILSDDVLSGGSDIKETIGLREAGGGDGYLGIMIISKPIDEAQKSLRIFEVSTNKVDSTENITINGVVWRKLVVANDQIFLLTNRFGLTYVIQYATFDSPAQQTISTFKITR